MELQGPVRLVLQALRDLQGGSPDYVADTSIADRTKLLLADVRECLRMLEGDGAVALANTTEGLTAFIEAKGRLALTQSSPVGTSPPPKSQSGSVKIVPKGLRSFDAGDAYFFLELLPGPRDQDGLPESIRCWKARIETTDPDSTFTVGLIYGPSGSGKSSLVKAGLLPRLVKKVTAVYVEATAEETEARLLKGLRRQVAGLQANLGLVESLAALRRGQFLESGQKVLLVLDQFEQWLHAKRSEENTELVQALRQCDGDRAQCVVMVRADHFWVPVTRFMQMLEVRVVEGKNSELVDLFDLLHARKVLAEFGRGYGRLPDDLGKCTKDQNTFLDQAVAGLADRDGKVISVRLALFAQIVEGKPWTPATLKLIGGTEGVGIAFLETKFTSLIALPHYRLHEKAARSVLKTLLPEAGTDIKGNMQSHGKLLEASGYARRPRDFEELLSILNNDVRLVTPTEPEGTDSPDEQRTSERYYQLTHDYLVPSLREWLHRKQKETWGGRAEIRLAERAASWNAKPESRHLPAWWEWLNIRLLTRKRNWTEPQRKMMGKAGRFHAVRGLGIAVLLAAVTLAGLFIYREVVKQNRGTRAAGLVRGLLDADTARVPGIIEDMGGYRDWTEPLLREASAEADRAEREADSETERATQARRQLHARLALLPVDAGQLKYLYGRLLDAGPHEVPVIIKMLSATAHSQELTDRLWAVVEQPPKGQEGQRLRAACALAAYDPDNQRWDEAGGPVVQELVTVSPVFLGPWMEALRPVREKLLGPLAAVFRDRKEERAAERSLATSILVVYAADRPEVLANLLQDADEKQFAVLFPKVLPHRERAVSVLDGTVKMLLESKETDAGKEALAHHQANAAVTLLRLGQAETVWPLLRHRHDSDPRVRSYLIHRLALLGTDPGALVSRLKEEKKEVSVRRALLLALGEFGPEQLSPADREPLIATVLQLYRKEPDAGLHGAAEWLLRQWKQDGRLKEFEQEWVKDKRKREARLGQIRRELAKAEGRGEGYWYVNGQGQTMAVVPGPVTFRMGSPATEAGREGGPEGKMEMPHQKRIGRTFAIAAKEVTVGQFLRFRKDHDYNKTYSPTPDCPANIVTWYDAAAYCNWLSKQEGIPEDQWCYEPNKEGEYGEGMKLKASYLQLEGYRLPSEAEWEFACRAGSLTSRYYGEAEELLGRYAWYAKNSLDREMLPAGSLKPNDLGLFDMLGNALEWCQERLGYYKPGVPYSEDKEDIRDIEIINLRVLRGGSFDNLAMDVRSALRNRNVPASRGNSGGVRPARTFR